MRRNIRGEMATQRWSFADLGAILGMTRGAASLLVNGNGRILLEHVYNIALAAGVQPHGRLLPPVPIR